nr:putative ribonuclease H-like domain-containing protein [Tanacetum cinerariifolium]
MHGMEDISTFNFLSDHEDDDEEAGMNNTDTTIQVSRVATTRIHKDHPLDQVIGDLHSTTQTRIKAIRLFLAYDSFKDFVVYQMDVKSAFLYEKIKEEVYVCQPSGFEDPDFPDKVYKVKKALYGLHQALRAWYETLSTYLLDNGFNKGKIDKTLFIRRHKDDILLVQVYVDDIIFGLTKKELCNAFEKMMHEIFQMSSMGELTFFLGFQVKQKQDGIFISQDKYATKILRKYGFSEVKNTSTPIETQKPLLKDEDVCACARYQVNPKVSHLHAIKRIFRYLKGQLKFGLWYLKDSPFDLVAYTDSDYAGASLDRKSTTRGCQFLGCILISWQCKKQNVVVYFTTELNMWLLQVAVEKYSGFKINCLIMEDTIAQTRSKRVSKISNDPLLVRVNTPQSDEDSQKLTELMELCTKLQQMVLDLETTKTTQAMEIESLKRRVKKLERRKRSKTHGLKKLYKMLFDVADDLRGEEVFILQEVPLKKVSAVDEVNAFSTATTTTATIDDITLANALMEIKSAKPKTTTASTRPKAKGLVIHDQEQAPTSIVSS